MTIFDTEWTAPEYAKLAPLMSNWQIFSAFISTHDITLRELEVAMTLERKGRNREHFIRRLIAKYCSDKTRVMKKQLVEIYERDYR